MLNIKYLLESQDPWDKVVYSAMQMGFAKNKNFLSKLIKAGKVMDYQSGSFSRTRRQAYSDRICSTVDVFNSKYGDDWDVVLEEVEGLYIIHFVKIYKKLIIDNSRGENHILTDLVIRFGWSFVDGELRIDRIQGTRMSSSNKELDAGYLHSHLHSIGANSTVTNDYFDTTDFCVGSDSEIRNLEDDLDTEYDTERYELYLYTVDSVAAYESIEGTPYIYMNKIVIRRKRIYDQSDNYGYKLIQEIMEEKELALEADFYVSEDRYKIKHNVNFVNFIKHLMISYLSEEIWKKFLVQYNLMTKTYFPFGEMALDYSTYKLGDSLKTAYFFYQGQKITFKIKQENTNSIEPLKVEDFTIHPKLIDYVISKFESELYRKAVRLSRVAKQNSISHI